ncbi:MAG: diphthamide biosynthesis enzyme Dph2, partial [archaeon]|nr:diphthamide biosynthesis enzyme Dph2 [archaeon]
KKVGTGKKVTLCSTVQYLEHLKIFAGLLKKKGLNVFIGEGKGVSPGQVLGCNYSSVKSVEGKVEAVVFLGDGLFHALGISFNSKKSVFTANPMSLEVNELENEKDLFLRKRYAVIAKAMDAKNFGILLSSKKGQLKGKLALKLKKEIEEHDREAFIFVSDFVKPEYIIGVKVDALVSTACPRIAFDDSTYFKQPLLSPSELSMVFGEKKLENYKIDEFL